MRQTDSYLGVGAYQGLEFGVWVEGYIGFGLSIKVTRFTVVWGLGVSRLRVVGVPRLMNVFTRLGSRGWRLGQEAFDKHLIKP